MLFLTLLGVAGFLAQEAFSTQSSTPEPVTFASALDSSVVLFDSPAFQHAGAAGPWIAAVPAFVSLPQLNVGPVTVLLTRLLASFGVDVGNRTATFANRVQLFTAIGLAGKNVQVAVAGCNPGGFTLAGTAGLPDLGQVSREVSLGTCIGGSVRPLIGKVLVGGKESSNGTIFPSPPGGFGVISGSLSVSVICKLDI